MKVSRFSGQNRAGEGLHAEVIRGRLETLAEASPPADKRERQQERQQGLASANC